MALSWHLGLDDLQRSPPTLTGLRSCDSEITLNAQINWVILQWPSSMLLFSGQEKAVHLNHYHKVSMDFICLGKHLQFRESVSVSQPSLISTVSGANIQQLHQKQLKDIFLPTLHSHFCFCFSFLKWLITSQQHMFCVFLIN